ncbi:MAG: DUF924 family protein [Pseudomonadota bacterium]
MTDPAVATTPDEVLKFWVEEVGPDSWYASDDALDLTIRSRFGGAITTARSGDLCHWVLKPSSALALLILLDQFPRNVYRGAPSAFASDAKAVRVTKTAIALGHDLKIDEPERQFFYLPLMHSESLADQSRCVRLILTRMPLTGGNNLSFAVEHREVVRQFGRFPYRNKALGRRSSDAEQAFLEELERAP